MPTPNSHDLRIGCQLKAGNKFDTFYMLATDAENFNVYDMIHCLIVSRINFSI